MPKHIPKNYVFNPNNLGDSNVTHQTWNIFLLTIDVEKNDFTKRINRERRFHESDRTNGKRSKAHPPRLAHTQHLHRILQDGNWYFTGYSEGLEVGWSLYTSYLTKKRVERHKEFSLKCKIPNPGHHHHLYHPMTSLYFKAARNVPGGFGAKTFGYAIEMKTEPGWTLNLGSEINTSADERTPLFMLITVTFIF